MIKNKIEFLASWEQSNNWNFKPIEFDGFKYTFRERKIYAGLVILNFRITVDQEKYNTGHYCS